MLDYEALYRDTTGSNRPTLKLGWAKHVPKMRPEHSNTHDTTQQCRAAGPGVGLDQQ